MLNVFDRDGNGFIGDGGSDEPETVNAISVAGREKLSKLIMVVDCHCQRLDGPVRGNPKVNQQVESVYRGAGFGVIMCFLFFAWSLH